MRTGTLVIGSGLLGSLVVAGVGVSAPVLATNALGEPPPIVGPSITLNWTAGTPSAGNPNPIQYELEVADLSTGQVSGKTVAATTHTMSLAGGRQYGFRLRAWQAAPAGSSFDREYSGYTEQETVWVDATAPTARIAPADVTVQVGTVASFSAADSSDGAPGPATAGIDFDAGQTFEWDWGDGSPRGSGRSAQHTYATAQTYAGTLTVRDKVGNTATTPFRVVVTPVVVIGGGIQVPPTITKLRVLGRLVAGRPSGVRVDVSAKTPLLVTFRGLRVRGNAGFVRRVGYSATRGTNTIYFSAPRRGNYILTIGVVGRDGVEVQRRVTVFGR